MKIRKDLSNREVADLQQQLMGRLGDSSVPTLPEVAVKVVQLVGNPHASLKDFVEVVQNDQALTARLLRTANSALYAQRQPVTQLQRAMVLLGLDRLKAMALGFHLSQAAASDNSDFSVRKLWAVSVFRAWTAFRLTEQFDRRVTGEAFIVGLMLDAGIPMMPKLAGEPYAAAVNPGDSPLKQFLQEQDKLPFTHVDVISSLAAMWKLPELLSFPISMHHTRPEKMNPQDQRSILHAVAYFVGTMQLSLDAPPNGPISEMAPLGRNLFGLDSAAVQRTLRDAAADYRGSREMFEHLLDGSVSIESILNSASKELSDSDQAPALSDPATKAPTTKVNAGSMILEMEPAAGSKVRVYIADVAGVRLASEELEPQNVTRDELRRILMLDDASEQQVTEIESTLRRLAA